MTPLPILLAGAVGSGDQNHQADQWVPHLAAAGLTVASVWSPTSVGDAALRRARTLAAALGVDLDTASTPRTPAAGALVCLRGAELAELGSFAARAGLPLLVDKPTLDTTPEITAFVAAIGAGVVVPGHHLSSHPGFARVLAAVRSAEIGLLRAVHADLVVGGGELSPSGELRNLGVYLVELARALTGPSEATVQAHVTGDGAAWSLLGRTDRGVVVSVHVARAAADASAAPRTLRAHLRVTGTHGFIIQDLTKPALTLSTIENARARPLASSGSVVAHLRRFVQVIGGAPVPPASDLVTLSRALDVIAESAQTGAAHTLAW